jgi:hypothetical protein
VYSVSVVAEKEKDGAGTHSRQLEEGSMTDVIFQFRINLLETDPLVWRRIQVDADATFWDLHVAIQDAMGWLDCHMHDFTVDEGRKGRSYT